MECAHDRARGEGDSVYSESAELVTWTVYSPLQHLSSLLLLFALLKPED
jgi:hypothetical protein